MAEQFEIFKAMTNEQKCYELNKMTIPQLVDILKRSGKKGWSKKSKGELQSMICEYHQIDRQSNPGVWHRVSEDDYSKLAQ